MSDRINALPWQPWSLKDFASQSEVPLSESIPDISLLFPNEPMEATAAVDEQQVLVNLQLEAEKQGRQQGFAKGLQEGLDKGYQTGLEEGHQQALADAQQQLAPMTAHWQVMVTDFQNTLDTLDSVIASRLVQIALAAAKQIIGQPAICDGTALLAQIQQMIQQEPMFAGKTQLRVNPDDLAIVEQRLGSTLSLHGWRLLGDSQIHAGGCKVSAEEGDLDASLATRWHELCRLAAPGEL
ncbi:flagellar assembly protein H [Yersinia pseudotuberculosis]|uniref:flagellar assembly protein FliH n=1 Tax=Yersinia pseudotuberculosis TaxID=633 RepID=UPI0004F7F39A|nr:flagellar assembly protein FliH [Yersinia pseudotuberculosis]AIN13890.1 flagellar assembly FliH family protein [Yersinia pseudotuberculosis]AJJ05300.1 flagellar assembly FliH family protein [Yersinia pseudotuberculosis]MBO1553703.1 flagellar assembly protein FliH [Yersinia pseudotuberculosis]MBO1559938.1 flagellar assembly protein FliH [Yersinia pseudotuberculosis]CNJ56629.1 flagellar assembly protein H [Yersinia pseudotuberculosis]